MDTSALEKLDTFPYRHRVSELMTTPLVCLRDDADIAQASQLMSARHVSSVVVLDAEGRVAGILTERDVLGVLARRREAAGAATVASAMSKPVHTIEADSLIYRALARMARLGLRHLPAVDARGRPVGMLTAGALLRQRATLALTLGDEVATAEDAKALRAVHDRLPTLARALRRERVGTIEISAAISGITRDLTARAAELASAEAGPCPARWCLLVLGSAGRGESLLAPDQDNALILEDGADDKWFARFAGRINELLDRAGIPLCEGGVMARNKPWRLGLSAWRDQVDSWVARPSPQALLNVDIFYDFAPVAGDASLADELRSHATSAAASSPAFLRLLAATGERTGSAFTLLGGWRLNRGRFDLKQHGLLPIVAGARAIGLAWRSPSSATDARLSDAAAAGGIATDAAQAITEARAVVTETILGQQLTDIEAGRAPGSRVDPARLKQRDQKALREALRAAASMPELVQNALSNRPLA